MDMTDEKWRGLSLMPELVRKLIDGKKSVTRRAVRSRNFTTKFWRVASTRGFEVAAEKFLGTPEAVCPFGKPGDCLYVRETLVRAAQGVAYVADGALAHEGDWKWQRSKLPARYCPRALSRFSLRITDVRLERLRTITSDQIAAEGFPIDYSVVERPDFLQAEQRAYFFELWDSLRSDAADKVAADPWVWSVAFERIGENNGKSE